MALFYSILVISQIFLSMECSAMSAMSVQGYTPLKINEIACTAEKLKSNGGRYTCNHEGNVHCTEGWEDEDEGHIDDANRCAIPKCDPSCKPHGVCTSPNFCACEVGWDGHACEVCIPMPGCVNGVCKKEMVNDMMVEVAQTCECEKFPEGHPHFNLSKYEGPKCDRPVCKPECENGGWCVVSGDTSTLASEKDAGKCACPIGFTHDEDHDSQQCSKCMAAAGCHWGKCARVDPMDETSAEIPGTCYCEPGFTGPLCDLLQCKDSDGDVIDCGEHGLCMEGIGHARETVQFRHFPNLGNATNGQPTNGCACEAGWQGEKCDQCIPYWDCPNQNVDNLDSPDGLSCLLPNQCWCKAGGAAVDHEDAHLCNSEAINGAIAVDPNAS